MSTGNHAQNSYFRCCIVTAGKDEKEGLSVDHRIPLKLHTILPFEGMSCHVEGVIGQGSNAIVYKGWYQDNLEQGLRHHVLIKELFPFHPQKKINRGEDGSIVVDPEARELWETHRKSFEIGNKVHLRLLYDHPDRMVMGGNLNSFSLNGTLYTVLGYTAGRSLQTELNHSEATLRQTAQRMIGLLDALEAFHKSGYLHLDISPDNVMLVGQEEQEHIFLIDYNSTREIGSRDSAYLSCKIGYSPPEVSTGDVGSIGFSSDLYSVAAVFYRSIMGRSLTLTERLRSKAPDGQDSPMLKGIPQTVAAMVGTILKKGLNTLPRRRYQSIGQMRQAFQELLDRIDCVGVTHWSLWENGKRSTEELIRINPSLRYLQEEKRLYPIRLEQECSMSLEQYLDELLSPDGKSGMILAQGGMGKTTLLLHTAMLLGKCYSASVPAVFYISLNGWDRGDDCYIRRQILMRLRFKPEENTLDSAMHALHKLLQQPLKTKRGNIPTVLLLLDGLNEIRGNIAPLVQEINELAKMAGVRILAASRSEIPELSLKTANLMSLDVEDIESALGRNGLLIPQKQRVIQLLRTPLILTIFIQTSDGGRQLNIGSEEELMKAYMAYLLEKEIRQLPEDSPQRWQLDAALNYVLPAIAAEVKKKGKALNQRQTLKVVKKCRKVLRSRLLQKAFPQWIGHTRDIFDNTVTADEWYAVIFHELLWKRCGMLAKDANGRYQVFHQAVSEYLTGTYRALSRRTSRSADPLSIVAWTWCILLLLSFYSTYCRELRWDGDRISSDYWGENLAVSDEFWDVYHAVKDYLAAPDEHSYQLVCSANSRAQMAVEHNLHDFTDTSLSELSRLQGQLLSLQKRKPEYLMAYDTGYISDALYTYLHSSVKSDYIIMLCTLDCILEEHRENKVSSQEVADLAKLIHSIHQQRGDLTELLGLWFEYPEPDYVGDSSMEPADIENAALSLQSLCEEFCSIYNGYSPELQERIREKILLFGSARRWSEELEAVSYTVPSGWIPPSWLPEDAIYTCVFLNPGTLEIQTHQYDPEDATYVMQPFAWYTVSFDISREELLRYISALENAGIICTVNDRDTFIQASAQFPETELSINWTDQQTSLILTERHSMSGYEGGNS